MKTLNIIVVIIVMMQPIRAFYRLPVLYNLLFSQPCQL